MTIQTGIPVARIELLDALQMQGVQAYSKLDLPESPTPVRRVPRHATPGSPSRPSRSARSPPSIGGGDFHWTTVAEERAKLWKARHDAYWASLALRPGARGLSTDVCVPISRLAECVAETEADIAEMG